MSTRFRFEKLEVWHGARALNRAVYALARQFPKDEKFALTSQMRRASVSVCANIAEGSGRNSDKDFAHFLEQSYGSLMELASLVYLAVDEGYASEAEVGSLLDQAAMLSRQIAALNRSLSVGVSKTPFLREPVASCGATTWPVD